MVFDNLNLQEMFLDEVAENLKLVNGTVWFQYNRKLCYKKINQFIHTIGHENLTKDEDVSKETNGDQMPCTYISLLSTQSVLTEIIHNVQIRKFYGVKL